MGRTDGDVVIRTDGVVTDVPLRWTDGRVLNRTDGGVAGVIEIL